VKIAALIVEHRLRYMLPCCADAGGGRVSICVSRFKATLRATIDWLRRLHRQPGKRQAIYQSQRYGLQPSSSGNIDVFVYAKSWYGILLCTLVVFAAAVDSLFAVVTREAGWDGQYIRVMIVSWVHQRGTAANASSEFDAYGPPLASRAGSDSCRYTPEYMDITAHQKLRSSRSSICCIALRTAVSFFVPAAPLQRGSRGSQT
jgi:hypothetical protein